MVVDAFHSAYPCLVDTYHVFDIILQQNQSSGRLSGAVTNVEGFEKS